MQWSTNGSRKECQADVEKVMYQYVVSYTGYFHDAILYRKLNYELNR